METFNLTQPGRTQSFFVQGGQRWETVRLLTDTVVSFNAVGLNTSSAHIPAANVPGQFHTSNAIYNDIWDLGARVAQVACVDSGNALSTWEITSEGALIRGQTAAVSAKGFAFSNYTLSFRTKIVRGGTGWTVTSGAASYGPKFYLTSNYPRRSTFLNTNRTLLPANTLVFGTPWSIVNQSTLETGRDQYFPIDVTVLEDTWYTIHTTITPEGYNVSIDNRPVAFISIFEAASYSSSNPIFSTPSVYEGTWGFGPWQDQAACVTDVVVTAHNGTVLYQNDLTSTSVLAEYSVATLDAPVCLDGAKRDRLVWIGDFYHTVRVIALSTLRWDYVLGTIQHVFSWQKSDAPFQHLVPISSPMGSQPQYLVSQDVSSGLLDYQYLFLSAVGNYFQYSGEVSGLQPLWGQIKQLVSATLAYVDPSTGLIAGSADDPAPFFFLGPANGSAVTALAAYTLRKLVPIATALHDTETADGYATTASKLSLAINSRLWNPSLGVYSLSLDAPSNFSLTAIAWTILSGTANSSQAASMITKLPELRVGVGYKTDTSITPSSTLELSPNTQGFLLEALFHAHRELGVQNLGVAKSLLEDFWSQMVTQDQYYSGASWEYVYPDGAPGIDLYTSLAHPWGAAPTYVMPEYVLGISATAPGYRTWTFQPLLRGLGLTEANGTVITPYGPIMASWKIVDGGDAVSITTTVPKGTAGKLVVNANADLICEGRKATGGELTLRGGRSTHVMVMNW